MNRAADVCTIGSYTYNLAAIDIWNMGNARAGSAYFSEPPIVFYYPTKGPVVYNTVLRSEMRPGAIFLQSNDDWKNVSGDITITLNRPANSSIMFYLMVN
jgi:hypothetical protein